MVYLSRCWVVGVGRQDRETLVSGRYWDAASRKADERRRERLTSGVEKGSRTASSFLYLYIRRRDTKGGGAKGDSGLCRQEK